MRQTVVLMILDGWGIGQDNESNPIHVVRPERFKYLEENYPMTSLAASGISVGLPWGEVGNSEVGHITLGAGKVVYQYFPKITLGIQDGTFFENQVLAGAFDHAAKNGSAVNFVGLLTKGNVHASLEHLQALLKMAEERKAAKVNLHLFADGLDSPPKSVLELLAQIPRENLATLTGRYYAMDRNQNWTLTQRAYECITGASGAAVADLEDVLRRHFEKNVSEEYLPPLRLDPARAVAANDAVVFFNYREDSIRQLAEAFIDPGFNKFPLVRPDNLYLATFTRYAEQFANLVAFPADNIDQPLGKVLADQGKTQLRLAETYKYAHVTYFFNGHLEPPLPGEYRVLVPSLPLTHPDEKPELMAAAITDRLLEAIQNQAFDFVLVNYSNPDTIAHTGNYDACLEAVRVMDRELGRILAAVEQTPTRLIITSDHGNLEEVLNPATGQMETQHDANPVPLHLVGQEFKGKKFANWRTLRQETGGILSDVAPTVLALMGIPKPDGMVGESLLGNLREG